jgi:alpha-tubulin suppressor-like RCC1 family protein
LISFSGLESGETIQLISLGEDHSLVLTTNGRVYAWGSNSVGQLGDGTITSRTSPRAVAGGFTDWCQVSAGGCHSLGVRTNGTAWAWGQSTNGKLGTGIGGNTSSPVSVVGGFTDWCQVSAGDTHSLGLRQNGTLWAWGSNCCGELGDGTIVSRSSPVSVIGGIASWCHVSTGSCNTSIAIALS